MIDIKNKKDCCGCHACGDVCHAQAISFIMIMKDFGIL